MMKGLMFQYEQQQQQPLAVEENMSNLTSASGEASASSGTKTEIGTNYPQQYLAPPATQSETQPPAKKKRNLPGNPDPDAEVLALSPKTLLATNRFICDICNKGFQRDQNLQLHRRGHNLPWKLKQRTNKDVIRKKVYVCPEPTCVHHDPSRALGDLTGIKKHFCRKHGEKKWKCDKCSKKYAVQSDWKAHSKTCGTREYRCDCGTLFSRRDSFITHRAFCDALAEESARGVTGAGGGASSASHHQISLQTHHHQQELHGFPLKQEQQQGGNSFGIRPEMPPWLGPHSSTVVDLSSSSMFSSTPRLLDQQDQHHHHLSLHESQNPNPSLGPTLPPYQPVASPHMSATALLQKAAQMGATITKTGSSSSSQQSRPIMLRTHQQGHVSSSAAAADNSSAGNATNNNNALISSSSGGGGFGFNLSSREDTHTTGFGHGFVAVPHFGNKAAASAVPPPPPTSGVSSPSLLQHVMNSFSSASGFDGASFEDAFGGILSSNKGEIVAKTTDGGGGSGGAAGGNDEALTRDFLGLRPLSHSDILTIAGMGNCMNSSSSSSSHDQQNHPQKPWQG